MSTKSIQTSHQSFAQQFETISALSQWMFWFAIMSAMGIVLVVTYVMDIVDIGMYAVMVGMAAIMIYKGFQDVVFFDRETKLASEQVKILETVHSFEAFLGQAKPSVFRNHIANLFEIAYTHPDVSQDNLIELLHFRLLSRNRVVELFSSILVTLGLIGTIVGLMIMMSRLQSQIIGAEAGNTNELIGRLFGDGGALVGLSTAFITTLIGAALGGVLLRVLTSVVDANIMRYIAHVAELTEVYVLPSMRRYALHIEEERKAAKPAPTSSEGGES